MSDVWRDLEWLLKATSADAGGGLTVEKKLDLLVQMVANLIDEVELLKRHAQQNSGLPAEEWKERYRRDRMWLLFSGAGGMPPCLEKYRAYLKDRQATAKALIPDEA